ncbi:uncharacterized protein KGF55_005199 [Candida pseudojiufengensis]|uniref:uncharacterized protein n=1 Tax=Candida pseudojiufengensis TaxID=497109 RepID=UPI002224DBAC|nr:uncharacterized protein KGF55_005199 [Candida pseudojiufengensis]KAI5959555.1 hypothetical protein KGF55_005199 [Candida pseudojiufengensis]
MGLLTIIRKQKLKDKEIRILTLGLDNSGKTTIIKKILNKDINKISPTMGFEINTIEYKNYTLNIWDIGGQTTLRSFWNNYFDKTDLIIWVIDSLSENRLQESFKELYDKIILQDRLTFGIYLLIVINKIDLIKDKEQLMNLKNNVMNKLKLNETLNPNQWNIELVSGITGEGIENCLEWIISKEF